MNELEDMYVKVAGKYTGTNKNRDKASNKRFHNTGVAAGGLEGIGDAPPPF